MTLVILGLDGLDASLVERYESVAPSFHLTSHGHMETVAVDRDTPHTTQVWPTMASGVSPEEHGMGVDRSSEWSNPFVEMLSEVLAPYLSVGIRAKLGDYVEMVTGESWNFGTIDESTFIDEDGVFVHNWPGVTNNRALRDVWQDIEYVHTSDAPQEVFDVRILAAGAEKFGWLQEALRHDVPVVGSHIHTLDSGGHAYATKESLYRRFYVRVSEWIEDLRETMDSDDELLIVSDHGIQTSWLGDGDPGEHSWRAFSSTTMDDRPLSVMEVREWIESRMDSYEPGERMDLPSEQLRQLGYIE